MAGHYSLNRQLEPKLFSAIESIKGKLKSYNRMLNDFNKTTTVSLGRNYEVMKLSKDYVENPDTEFAFMVGNFTLESIVDEHPSLIQNISVEVHLTINENVVAIKDIFWVA